MIGKYALERLLGIPVEACLASEFRYKMCIRDRLYADRLEKAGDFETALHETLRETIRDHKRIIFNGNGYDAAWLKEAVEKRGRCV